MKFGTGNRLLLFNVEFTGARSRAFDGTILLGFYSTIIIHSNNFTCTFTFNAFYIAINYFFHRYRIMTGEISLIFFDSILNETRGHNIDSNLIC